MTARKELSQKTQQQIKTRMRRLGQIMKDDPEFGFAFSAALKRSPYKTAGEWAQTRPKEFCMIVDSYVDNALGDEDQFSGNPETGERWR